MNETDRLGEINLYRTEDGHARKKLNRIAIEQMEILTSDRNIRRLDDGKRE